MAGWPRARKVIYLIGGLAGQWEGNLGAWLATGKVIYLIGGLAGQLACYIGDDGKRSCVSSVCSLLLTPVGYGLPVQIKSPMF